MLMIYMGKIYYLILFMEKMRERFEEALFNKLKEQYACVMSDGVAKNIAKWCVDYIMPIADTLLEEARQEMKETILKKIPELKVREIKLPQDDLRVLRARQYHNQKLSELSDFIKSL